MNENNQMYLIVMDYLFQKYEIEYEENMNATDVIKKVQQFLFPSERSEDFIFSRNEDGHKKLRLYRGTPSKYTEAITVTGIITKEELDYEKYQFYLFRPIMNVFINVYVVKERDLHKEHYLAKFDIIYPVKKKISLLKNYYKETLLKYTNENNKELYTLLQNGFTLRYESNGRYIEFNDESYVEHSLNESDMYLVINNIKDLKQNL